MPIGAPLADVSRERRRIMSDAIFYDTMQAAIALAIVVIALAVGRYFKRHFH
jgi:hypothetical protein